MLVLRSETGGVMLWVVLRVFFNRALCRASWLDGGARSTSSGALMVRLNWEVERF